MCVLLVILCVSCRWFIATLVTAIVALTLVTVLALAEFVAYYTDQATRSVLQPYIGISHTEFYAPAIRRMVEGH